LPYRHCPFARGSPARALPRRGTPREWQQVPRARASDEYFESIQRFFYRLSTRSREKTFVEEAQAVRCGRRAEDIRCEHPPRISTSPSPPRRRTSTGVVSRLDLIGGGKRRPTRRRPLRSGTWVALRQLWRGGGGHLGDQTGDPSRARDTERTCAFRATSTRRTRSGRKSPRAPGQARPRDETFRRSPRRRRSRTRTSVMASGAAPSAPLDNPRSALTRTRPGRRLLAKDIEDGPRRTPRSSTKGHQSTNASRDRARCRNASL